MSISERISVAQEAARLRGDITSTWRDVSNQPQTVDGLGDFKSKVHDALFERLGTRLFEATSEAEMQSLVMTEISRADGHEGIGVVAEEREFLVHDIARRGDGPRPARAAPERLDRQRGHGQRPPKTIYVERKGKLERTSVQFLDDEHVRRIIERIVGPLGRRIDESSPMVDARLPDGSRVNAIIPPLALNGPTLTIRKFRQDPFTVDDLIAHAARVTRHASPSCGARVPGALNIIDLRRHRLRQDDTLNVLSSFMPDDERIITIEDAAELQLRQDHVVRLEARPPNIEGNGRGHHPRPGPQRPAHAARPHRRRRVRGGEALDMLQAMNTGHDGSLTTVHANCPARRALPSGDDGADGRHGPAGAGDPRADRLGAGPHRPANA